MADLDAETTRPAILIADDDAAQVTAIRAALAPLGCRIEAVEDGDEALARLAEGEFDLLVLDLMMPRRDGFEVLERLSKQPGARKPKILVMAVTSACVDDTIGTRNLLLDMGADEITYRYVDLPDTIADMARYLLSGVISPHS